MYHPQHKKEHCCVHTSQHSGTSNSTSLYSINKQDSMVVDTRCVLCEAGAEVLYTADMEVMFQGSHKYFICTGDSTCRTRQALVWWDYLQPDAARMNPYRASRWAGKREREKKKPPNACHSNMTQGCRLLPRRTRRPEQVHRTFNDFTQRSLQKIGKLNCRSPFRRKASNRKTGKQITGTLRSLNMGCSVERSQYIP